MGKNSNVSGIDLNRVLSIFLFDYRNTAHSTTGFAPAYLMFNRKLRTRFDCLLREEDFVDKGLKDRVSTEQKKQAMYYGGRRCIEFKIGETVLVKDYRNVSKPVWIKAMVLKRIGKNVYLVSVPTLGNVKWKRHLNQIKKFTFKPACLPVGSTDVVQTNSETVSEDCEHVIDDNEVTGDGTPRPEGSFSDCEVVEGTEDVVSKSKRQVKPVDRWKYDKF